MLPGYKNHAGTERKIESITVERKCRLQNLTISVFSSKHFFLSFHAAFPTLCRPSNQQHVKRYIKELAYVPYNQARLTVCFSRICQHKLKRNLDHFSHLPLFKSNTTQASAAVFIWMTLITCFSAHPIRVEMKMKTMRGLSFSIPLHTLSKLVDFSSAKRKRIMYRTSEATQQKAMNGRYP